AQHLTRADIAGIEGLAPDILLLAGGTDGGNRDVILHNARALAESGIDCPVVLAGNRAAGDEIAALFYAAGKSSVPCENVMPEFGQLNVEPAREVIRNVFIESIVHAKGIDRAHDLFDRVLMPTPAAVLDGARLLAEGFEDVAGLGELMVVDVGGATTDVHSVAKGEPEKGGVIRRGLPEPYVKRTVEGDLGMRHNAGGIVAASGLENIAALAGVSEERAASIVDGLSADVTRLPSEDDEHAVDAALARAAVSAAAARHAGTIETVYTVNGPATIQHGKDLSGVGAVIGTGGVLARGDRAAEILRACLADPAQPLSLRPRAPKLLLDGGYLLFAVGLLGSVAPREAVMLGLTHMQSLGEAIEHEPGTVARG
ncbi:MAG: glutamate mutase L, partial [Gammaproteobacteria bacterium]|nr:glutamate mutase L [Gammaproteobacteria bacterium]